MILNIIHITYTGTELLNNILVVTKSEWYTLL